MYKYSIIVPTYNAENFIINCADSLKNQNFKNYEVLFINDGSTDNTLKVLNKYIKDNKLTNFKVITKKNGGVSSSRNYGIKHATGEYLLAVDSDDFVTNDFLEKIDKSITNDVDILIFSFYEYFDDNNINKKIGVHKVTDILIKDALISAPAQWNKAIRRSLFTQNNISFPEGLIYEDLGTIPKLFLLTNKIKFTDEYIYYYRQQANSIMHTFNEKLFNIYPILDSLKDFYNKNDQENIYRDELEKIFIYNTFFIINTLGRVKFKNKLMYQKKAVKYLKTNYPNWYKNPYLKEENFKTKMHILIMKYNFLLPIYNLFRGLL